MSDGLFSDHIGMINELFNERPDVPTREQQLEAQIADLKKQLRDVENERDVRGMLLDQIVDMRERLIDSKSNSWIDSIATIETEIMNGQTNEWTKQTQITIKDAKIKHLEEIANRIVHAL